MSSTSSPSSSSSNKENRAHSKAVLKSLQKGGSKMPKKDSALQTYKDLARWIPLGVDTFIDFSATIYAAIDPSNEPDEELLSTYEAIRNLEPRITEVLKYLNKDPDQLTNFIKECEEAINNARSDDTSSLKPAALTYVLRNPNKEHLDPKVPEKGSKAGRGAGHPVLMRHLCPIKKLARFDQDPQLYMNRVNEGIYKLKSSEWPSFVYDLDMVDKNDVTKGLMRGYYLLRVFRHIFTSPSSATSGHRNATKPSKSESHGLKEVTGRSIAYAAVQARFAICSVEKWQRKDGAFDLKKFYDNIVALFETNPKHPWAIETLKYWNSQVPDLKNETKRKRKRKAAMEEEDANDSENEALEEVFQLWETQNNQATLRSSPAPPPPQLSQEHRSPGNLVQGKAKAQTYKDRNRHHENRDPRYQHSDSEHRHYSNHQYLGHYSKDRRDTAYNHEDDWLYEDPQHTVQLYGNHDDHQTHNLQRQGRQFGDNRDNIPQRRPPLQQTSASAQPPSKSQHRRTQAIRTPPPPNQRRRAHASQIGTPSVISSQRRTHASQTPNQYHPRGVNYATRPSQQEPSTGGRPLQSQRRRIRASQVVLTPPTSSPPTAWTTLPQGEIDIPNDTGSVTEEDSGDEWDENFDGQNHDGSGGED